MKLNHIGMKWSKQMLIVMNRLFIYLTNLSNDKFYDIQMLSNKINMYLEICKFYENNQTKGDKTQKDEDKKDASDIPDKIILESALKLINLGAEGLISINELVSKVAKNYRKILSEKIDKNKMGLISYPDFIKRCREIYGTDINLNYKLCAQYLYKVFIKSGKKVEKYILHKLNQTNINVYLDIKVNPFIIGSP